MEAKFKVGDRVISIKNTPDMPEGFIGVVTDNTGVMFTYKVKNDSGCTEMFNEDELELLAVSGLNIPKRVSQENIQALRETLDKINDKPQSALDKQVSGSHYKDFKIQPAEYCHANNIPFLEGNVIKYTSRHKTKNKAADIKKAIHCLELILQLEYGE